MTGLQDDEEKTQRILINAAMIASDVPFQDALQRYFEFSGVVDAFEVRAYLAGLVSIPVEECNLLAHAINELIDEQPPHPRAPYRRDPAGNTAFGERDEALDELLRQWLFGAPDQNTRPRPDT